MLFDELTELGWESLIPKHPDPDWLDSGDEEEDNKEDIVRIGYHDKYGDEAYHGEEEQGDEERDTDQDADEDDNGGYDDEDDGTFYKEFRVCPDDRFDWDDWKFEQKLRAKAEIIRNDEDVSDEEFEDRYAAEHYNDADPYSHEYAYETIYDMKEDFGMEDMEDEDFLELSVADLIGINKSQLKFIDLALLDENNFSRFCHFMKAEGAINSFPDIQQRIKYALVRSNVADYGFIYIPQGDQLLNVERPSETKEQLTEYLEKMIARRSPRDSIVLIDLLRDYYRNWVVAKHVDAMRADGRLEGAPLGYPVLPKASRIHDLHDKAARDAIYYDSLTAAHKETLNEKMIKAVSEPVYTKYLYKDGKWGIFPITGYKELQHEGHVLKHCVGTYAHAVARGESMIYGIRPVRDPKTPFFTAELRIEEVPGRFVETKTLLTQCYGKFDTTDKPEDCKDFIKKWCKTKRIKIDCQI